MYKDDETWQFYLSKLTKKNVLNFGNGAYGPDQALLRFNEEIQKVRTQVVALGLTTENIARVVNIYRKFYLINTGHPSTKPRFVFINRKLHNFFKTFQSQFRLKFYYLTNSIFL